MDDPQDREIARGLRQGKAEAWTALYEAYFDRVWRCAARLTGPNAADVADVVQETFLAAARSVRSYDPARGSLWLWLGGIARHQAANHWRQRQRSRRLDAGGDLHGPVARQLADWLAGRLPAPGEVLASAETAGLVRAALAQLPEDYHTLLTAKYCDGASVAQIAAAHDSSTEAVRSKLARARRAFREAFARASSGSPCTQDGQAGAQHEP